METASKIKNGNRAVGTMVRMIRNPAIANIAANAGLDFFILDMEHGPYTLENLVNIAGVARGAGVDCFVRVPELAKGYVSRALDAGCSGVMVPMIAGVEEAKALADWSKYPPTGNRGFGSAGGHTRYAPAGKPTDFFAAANSENVTIAQIETVSAIEQIEGIASTDGIDALLIGPNDLAISFGVPGQLDSDTVQEAIGKVAAACQKFGKVFGMHGPDALTQRWIPEGLKLIMSSIDISMLSTAMSGVAEKYREG